MVCGHKSNTFEQFMDLSLEVGTGISSLNDALKHFMVRIKFNSFFLFPFATYKIRGWEQINKNNKNNIYKEGQINIYIFFFFPSIRI